MIRMHILPVLIMVQRTSPPLLSTFGKTLMIFVSSLSISADFIPLFLNLLTDRANYGTEPPDFWKPA